MVRKGYEAYNTNTAWEITVAKIRVPSQSLASPLPVSMAVLLKRSNMTGKTFDEAAAKREKYCHLKSNLPPGAKRSKSVMVAGLDPTKQVC